MNRIKNWLGSSIYESGRQKLYKYFCFKIKIKKNIGFMFKKKFY